ncbi:RNase H1/viroplasmin domain-containing protein [Pontibacter anaerobius]|uniref:RNase H1/viroplasmin domain-containing protein n=1 Tax=Pontibacter anaerobius TaxID=2993940 RepID=A0ABT3RIT3_9BACT|nr:RNase H1/viroplasmin domain-containing protein [Pontibacter anaerobius]MCX2741465.1 RNase H1/viroplasmin domain-containing protein [Pontibacter anaerobius]
MSKKKNFYYVVWIGRTPGIYDNWFDCEAQVKGYSGAIYKSFPSYWEAKKAYEAGIPKKEEPPKSTKLF